MSTAYITHPSSLLHDMGPYHPECPDRLTAIGDRLISAGLDPYLHHYTAPMATHKQLARAHGEEHIAAIAAASPASGLHFLDPDTALCPHTLDAARHAAGALILATDLVVKGECMTAFCAVRPPGHHATPDRAMGFCLFNNVAVAAAHALARGLERVLILDFDVHHGNGTQNIFAAERRVLYVSSHAWPFYPGTGALQEAGEGNARGFTVNLPMPMGCGDGEYAHLYREVVVPIGRAFDPELVLVSAGFDAYAGDPLAGMRVTAPGYAELAGACLEAAGGAAAGRAVFVLEGGYDLDGLSAGGAAVAGQLLGDPRPGVTAACAPSFAALVTAQRRFLATWWPIG